MSTVTLERPASGNGEGAVIVRPQQTIGALAEQSRVQAEIQSRLMVAKSCPRDEVDAVDRIKTACQRPGLAEKAAYVYSRGGTEITGPTIDLLTVIANHWGNIDYGFRELSQSGGESHVEAFAWDLETNAKRTVAFTVPHKRHTRSGSTVLTDPRDIYEMVANNAQRRVRACLEAIIPPDVVEDAALECHETMKATAQVTPDSIAKTVAAYEKIGVTKEQLEKRLGRRLDSMQPAQLVNLRKIYKSVQDGMSKPGDWFEQAQEESAPKSAADATKDALRKKVAPKQETASEESHDRPNTTNEPDTAYIDSARSAFAKLDTVGALRTESKRLFDEAPNEATRSVIDGLAIEAEQRIESSRGERSNK